MKNSIKLLFPLIILLFLISCEKEEEKDPPAEFVPTETSADVYSPISGDIVGSSTLIRNENSISIDFETSGLIEGHAYTLWWVIWNKPENCTVPNACQGPDLALSEAVEVELILADGSVCGVDGTASYSAILNENDISESANSVVGFSDFGGLNNALTAEVHMVLRSHGPAMPDTMEDQISSFTGGCMTTFPGFTQVPSEEGECGNIQASIHLAQ